MKSLEELYAMLPPIKCIPGCTNCCGPAFAVDEEMKKLKRHKKLGLDLVCPLRGENGCKDYKHRPLICRAFGVVQTKLLICPHGCRAEHPLTKEQFKLIMDEYKLYGLSRVIGRKSIITDDKESLCNDEFVKKAMKKHYRGKY